MAWIKFEKDLQTDPRVLRLARALTERWGMSEATVTGKNKEFEICNAPPLPAVTIACGALVRLWCLADTHVAEDDMLRLSPDEIDAFIGLPGFCSLVPGDWFVDHGDSVELPGFHSHNGTLAKTKAVTAKRVERHRNKTEKALHDVTHIPLPDQTRPDQTKKDKNTVGLKPDLKALAKEVLEFLNTKTGRNYQPVPANVDMIVARLKEGSTVDDCRAVVAKKCREWSADEKMVQYLRPATLFNRTKFAQYRGEIGNG